MFIDFQKFESKTCRFFFILCRYLASVGPPDQIVPDIDSAQDQEEAELPKTQLEKTAELELRLNKMRDGFLIKDQQITVARETIMQPPIRRINEDARPLTAAEILANRHFF